MFSHRKISQMQALPKNKENKKNAVNFKYIKLQITFTKCFLFHLFQNIYKF